MLAAVSCWLAVACGVTPADDESLMCSAGRPLTAAKPAADVWRARRLSRGELASTFGALVGATPASLAQLPQDGADLAAPASSFDVDVYRQVASEAAQQGARPLLERWACDGSTSCLSAALRDWLETAFRGPLSDEEHAGYSALLPAPGTERALRELLELAFQSPRFLYVVERGVALDGLEQSRELTPWELAARLSYFLWSEPPDAALRDDARSGRLSDPAVLRAHALRLLHDPRASRTVGSTLQRWSAPELDTLTKAANIYPEWDPELRGAMLEQFQRFAQLALERDYTLSALLTTRLLPLNGRLAVLTGTAAEGGGDWAVIESTQPRFGLLTLPGVLAANARADDSSPVQRGLFIRQNLLCQIMPPPPPGVPPLPAAGPSGGSFRDRFAAHTQNPVCASCHQLMDPLGFPFEIYDGIGRLRTNADSLDTAGKLDGVSAPVSFQDLSGLVDGLLGAPELPRCWATQWARRALGSEASLTPPLLDRLAAEVSGGASLADLLVEIVATPEFRVLARPN